MRYILWIGSIILLCFIAMIITFYVVSSMSLPKNAHFSESSLYDRNGHELATVSGSKQATKVSTEDISKTAIAATISIEDRRFNKHFGLDWRGIARAILANIKTGSKKQGASTITQQLARNLYLSHEKTWSRKWKEAIYAIRLEKQWSKEKILNEYLNRIYYGHAAYGIEAAAQTYFAKSAKQLNLAESAMLAGIPKGPKYYSPFNNFEQAKKRQRIVLHAMRELGFISAQEADSAYREKITLRTQQIDHQLLAPYFVEYVRQHALDSLAFKHLQTKQGNLRIETTLDLDMQRQAEATVAKHLKKHPALQISLLSIDPRNGHIKAMIGGRDFKKNQFNRTLSRTRQPGSAFKPIVYLTALMNGATAISKHRSEPAVFVFDQGKRTYTPKNFANRYAFDWVDMRYALAHSDNIYAVKTLIQTGPEKVISLSRQLGIRSALSPLPSLALGAFPVRSMELVYAYGAIANQGKLFKPTAIQKISNEKGQILHENKEQAKQVFSAEHAYVLTKMMEDVFARGGTAARVAHFLKRPTAGKTGTTNADAWMIGFTPELVTAVWVGHDEDRPIRTSEAYLAAPIFAEFTEKALQHLPPKMFTAPVSIVSVYVDVKSGKLAGSGCPTQRLEYFVEGTEPKEFCQSLDTNRSVQQKNEVQQRSQLELDRSWLKKLSDWWNAD
jgi:1A family penicillin-binding protein